MKVQQYGPVTHGTQPSATASTQEMEGNRNVNDNSNNKTQITQITQIAPGPGRWHRATSPDSLVERPRSVPAPRGRLEPRPEMRRSGRHPERRGRPHERDERHTEHRSVSVNAPLPTSRDFAGDCRSGRHSPGELFPFSHTARWARGLRRMRRDALMPLMALMALT